MSLDQEIVSNLPFSSLSNNDFNDLFSGRVNWNTNIDLNELLSNPDKFDECDPDLMLMTPCSDYCSISKFKELINDSGPKGCI